MDLFEVEARSWSKFEVKWKPTSLLSNYVYHLQWVHLLSSTEDNRSIAIGASESLLTVESDGVKRLEDGILTYNVTATNEEPFGGIVKVTITTLIFVDDKPPEECRRESCCALINTASAFGRTSIQHSSFFKCLSKFETNDPHRILNKYSQSFFEGKICFQVADKDYGPGAGSFEGSCPKGPDREVKLYPPPDSRGLNIANQSDNQICVQWRPPANITSAEFLYKNVKRMWTRLFQVTFSPAELKEREEFPILRCVPRKDEILLFNPRTEPIANETAQPFITVQIQVVYAGDKNNKYDFQVRKPFKVDVFPSVRPPDPFPTVFIASLAAIFSVTLLFLVICLLYRRLSPVKANSDRILQEGGSITGSIGAISTMRTDTPVNAEASERVELMATLSRISHMPIVNSFMSVDNPLYPVHSGDMPSDEDLKSLPHFPRTSLTLVHYLGSGAFGNVYAGEAKDIHGPGTGTVTVAVKTLQPNASGSSLKWPHASVMSSDLIWGQNNLELSGASLIRRQMGREPMQQQFLAEALLMAQFHHEHILPLIGVCLDPHPDGPYMLLEFMDKGDLSNYLKSMRNSIPPLTLSQLLQMAIQVAMGCKYLEDLHFVHRDLAARNCLVSSLPNNGAIVKVGDFGLARDIYRNDYYRMEMDGKVPFKWMSPESLMDRTWTTKADVWSFGVLIWEIMSLGQQPYPARTNHEVLQFLKDGGRLEKPDNCPDDIYKIMNWCWAFNAEDRPSFAQLVIQLEHLYNQAQRSSGLLRRQGSAGSNAASEGGDETLDAERSATPNASSEAAENGDEALSSSTTTHKLRVLTPSSCDDGVVYHVLGAGDAAESTPSRSPAVSPRPPSSSSTPSRASSASTPRALDLRAISAISCRVDDADVDFRRCSNRDSNPGRDSPSTVTSSLVSSPTSAPATPSFQLTPPATPAAPVSPSIPSTLACLPNADCIDSSALPTTPDSIGAVAAGNSFHAAPSSSSSRSSRRLSPTRNMAPLSECRALHPASSGAPPLSPPPTPVETSNHPGDRVGIQPLGQSTSLQRYRVPMEVKRPKNRTEESDLPLSKSSSFRRSGNSIQRPSVQPPSPPRSATSRKDADLMTTSFPSSKVVRIHPLQRTLSLEERGSRFRPLISINKLLEMKSLTTPAIIPEAEGAKHGPTNVHKPVKSCLRRGQRTISGGDPSEPSPHFSSSSSSSSSSTVPSPSLEDTLSSLQQPDARRFMLRVSKAGDGGPKARAEGVTLIGGVPGVVSYRRSVPEVSEAGLTTMSDSILNNAAPPLSAPPQPLVDRVFFDAEALSKLPLRRSASWRDRGRNEGRGNVAGLQNRVKVPPPIRTSSRSRLNAVSSYGAASSSTSGAESAADCAISSPALALSPPLSTPSSLNLSPPPHTSSFSPLSPPLSNSDSHPFFPSISTPSAYSLSPPLSTPSQFVSSPSPNNQLAPLTFSSNLSSDSGSSKVLDSVPRASVQIVQCHLQGVSPPHDSEVRLLGDEKTNRKETRFDFGESDTGVNG